MARDLPYLIKVENFQIQKIQLTWSKINTKKTTSNL